MKKVTDRAGKSKDAPDDVRDGKSHSLIIPTKLPNEAEPEAKEAVEEGLAKGKTLERNRFRTQRRQILSNTLERIREGKEGSEHRYHSYSSATSAL